VSRGIPNTKYPDGEGTVKGGAKLATVRALLSLDYAITANLMLGGRIGFAFGGGPKNYSYASLTQVNPGGKAFLPIHVEPRLTYHFVSLGKPGPHPYIHAGGGLAQVDAKMDVQVCNKGGVGKTVPENTPNPPTLCDAGGRSVLAYKRLGQGFVTVGGGLMYPFGMRFGAVLNVNLMYMLPVSGIVVEPSLGGLIAF
jgi:hypothetical protein